MSLDKAIEHGKERRKWYYRSKAFDSSCRNHGDCPWCESGRKHQDKVRARSAEEEIGEFEEESEDEDYDLLIK